MYFANGSNIQELALVAKLSQPHQVVAGLANADALDYNPLDHRIYWIDGEDMRISRVFANGSNVEAVVTFDLTRPAGIAVDPLGGNIFFSDKGQKRITVATQNGKYRRVLLWEGLRSPEALQLDPSRGVLFWLDTGPPASVERARVDGSNRSTVIDLSGPGTYHGLAVDTERQRLYWTRTTTGGLGWGWGCAAGLAYLSVSVAGRAVIEYCSYNGSGLGELSGIDLKQSSPYAVAVWQDVLFWSQLSSGRDVGSIFSRHLNGTVETLYENSFLTPYDIVHAFSNLTLPGECARVTELALSSVLCLCHSRCCPLPQRATHAGTIAVGRSVWCCPPLRGGASVSPVRWRCSMVLPAAPVSWHAHTYIHTVCVCVRACVQAGLGQDATVWHASIPCRLERSAACGIQ